MMDPQMTSQDVLGPLLSAESLIFGTLNIALSLTAGSSYGKTLGFEPRTFAHWGAALVTLLGCGAAAAWVDIFIVGDFPERWGIPPVVALAIGIVAMPVIAIIVARNVNPPPPQVH